MSRTADSTSLAAASSSAGADQPPPGQAPAAAGQPAPRQVVTVHLRNIPLLAGLDSDTLTRIGGQMKFRNVERGGYVLHKGGDAESMVFVLAGRLKIIDVTEDGREIALSPLNPGDYAGELSVIDGLGRSASLIASESSLVGFLPRAAALELIYSHAPVAEKIMKRLAAKIRLASDQRAILSIPGAFQRVFALLSDLAQPTPDGLTVIDQPPTQQEIAGAINAARETVSRAMQVLLQKGIVEKDQRRLIIRQPAALRQLALEERGGGGAAH